MAPKPNSPIAGERTMVEVGAKITIILFIDAEVGNGNLMENNNEPWSCASAKIADPLG